MAHRSRKATPGDDLDERQATILRAVVVEHVDTAQPVGSAAVAHHADLDVSPATVRSEMVTLEREGYLSQPHTSAGRIPTDKGYRYFVDHLTAGSLGPVSQSQVRDFFAHVHGEVEDVLEQTSNLLSRMTNLTSVVVSSGHPRASILSAQLVNLDRRHHLLVTVFSDGAVTKHTILPTYSATPLQVAEASKQLQALLIGTTLDAVVQVPARQDTVAKLVRDSVAVLHAESPRTEGEQVFIGGSSKVAEVFDGVETVRQVLSILEQELLVVSLVEDMLDRGLSVAIGAENSYEPLASCAVIVAPVAVDGETVGAVGVLGPTRMKYGEVLVTAEAVSNHLAQHFGGES